MRNTIKYLFYLIVFLLVGGFICAKTNPDRDEHVKTLTTTLVDEIKSGNILPGVTETKLAGVVTSHSSVGFMVDKKLVIDDYAVFSIGKIQWIDEDYVVSLGILGKVFTFSDARVAEDYIHSLEQQIKEKL